MRCPRCQHDNRPGAKFCEECAAPLARRGGDLSATARFCPECAHPTAPAPAPPTLAREPLLSFFDSDPTQDLRPLLPRIAVPTLVTRGTADRVSGAADAEELAAGTRGARLHAFPGRCHVPIFTATTEFCEVLRRFARPAEGETSP